MNSRVAASSAQAPPAPSLADSDRVPDLWLHLPAPPSANNLFVTRRDGRGRAKTSAYKEWLLHAGWHVKAHCVTRPLVGPVRLWIEAGVSRQRDLDNLLKPIGDLLSKSLGIMPNDRWIDDLRIVRRREADNVLFISLWGMGRREDGESQKDG